MDASREVAEVCISNNMIFGGKSLTIGSDWEGFGADPVLQAFGGALSVEGIQSTGVIATIKHLIANEQEMYRMWNIVKPGYSSNVDDRTLHELYLWPFAEGKSNPISPWNGRFTCIELSPDATAKTMQNEQKEAQQS